jgi:hypothetical protein
MFPAINDLDPFIVALQLGIPPLRLIPYMKQLSTSWMPIVNRLGAII